MVWCGFARELTGVNETGSLEALLPRGLSKLQSQGILHSSRRERGDGRNRRKGGSNESARDRERERERELRRGEQSYFLAPGSGENIGSALIALAFCSAFEFLPRLAAGFPAFLRTASRLPSDDRDISFDVRSVCSLFRLESSACSEEPLLVRRPILRR